jgi:hypothetical protein
MGNAGGGRQETVLSAQFFYKHKTSLKKQFFLIFLKCNP